jgi:hypothetical protein
MTTDEEIDDFLAHHGVKGMHWGVRKSPEQQKRAELQKINRKINRLNPDNVQTGLDVQGFGISKQYKKEVRKNPNFTFGKLSPAEKKAYEDKANSRARRAVVTRGAIEVAVILAGGNIAVNKLAQSPSSRQGAKIAVLLLAGQAGYIRLQQLGALHHVIKAEKLRDRRDALTKELKNSGKEVKMATDEDVEDFLAHHGVKGMHWGVHKARPTTADIHTARQAQMQRRLDYNKAKKSGDAEATAKAAEAFNKSPDRALAAHLTRGEKIGAVLLSPVGAAGIGTVRANVGANLTGKSMVGHLLLDDSFGPLSIARAGHQAKKLSS